ncbi:MAG: amidohydrolase [Novosphingobium sp.]|nr:amidohydrolase [Novosphingobium sp.]
MQYNVISADNHILEPRDLFTTRLPKEYRDRAPRVIRGEDGGDGWSWDGRTVARTLGIEATAGRAVKISGYTWEEILPGNYDGAAHLADMQQEGVDAAVLFPSVPLMGWSMHDDPFGLALMQTFNDWVFDDFTAPDPKRLIALPMMPVNHAMDVLLAELDRMLKKGAKAVHIPVFPDKSYIDTYWDPFWAAVAEAGVPLCMHRTSGGIDTSSKTNFQFKVPGVNVAGTVIRFFSGVEPLTMMIFTGVFNRHPGLRIMDAEVNFGWIPYWKQQMDQSFEQQKGWARFPFENKPSETLGKNVFVTILDDKVGFDQVANEPVMADVALFSIDYPHSVCLWPNTRKYIDDVTMNVAPDAKHKILAGNAVKLFNLD